VDTLLQDIRYTLRGLRRSPGFTLVAVLTIGLSIGMNTTAFTWMENMVLRPLPAVPNSDQLVSLNTGGPGGDVWSVSYPNYRDWRDGARGFEGLAAYTIAEMALRTAGPSQRVWGVAASGNYFDVLRVRPLLGRTFRPDEEAAAAPVAVISHGLWRRAFGGDSGVVGQRVLLNGHGFTVIGVAPPRFAGTMVGLRLDLWFPVTLYELLTPNSGALTSRGANFLVEGIGRLRRGVTIEQARQDINAVHRRLAETYPTARNSTVLVRWSSETGVTSWFRALASTLFAVTAVVLFIACGNLANLLLARAAARRREIGVRLAVGAGRARLVRQLLTESVVLASGGGLAGLVFAFWAKDVMRAFIPASPYPIGLDMTIDGRVLGVAAIVTLCASLFFGLMPALQATRVDLVSALRDGAATGPARQSRVQAILVASQVAFSLVALVCAGLFVRGLQRAQSVDTGMRDPQQVLLVNTNLYVAGYTDSTGPAAIGRLLERVRALPGVRAASASSMVPLTFGGWNSTGADVEGYAFRPDEMRAIPFSEVGPDYFEAIGTPVVRGRGIVAQDQPGSPPVAVVNEAFARRYWAGQDPIGKHITVNERERAVVGVVRDAKYVRLDEPPPPIFYLPILQSYSSSFTLQVRTAGDPRALQQLLRRAFEDLDPNLPLTDVRTLAESMGAATFIQRIGAWSLATFGLHALLLAALGIFGVLWISVSRRTREMGVRLAVGASRRDVLRLVIGDAMRIAGIGLGVGIVLAAGAGRLLRSQIFGVSPLDPVTFVGVTALLAAVALLAAWLPARRAAKVDPVIALQAE
jgi:predicted permease